jgi:drug/metabolite transporter (DMT)-like permease
LLDLRYALSVIGAKPHMGLKRSISFENPFFPTHSFPSYSIAGFCLVIFSEFILLLISVLASVFGQFFLKSGALKLGKVSLENLFGHLFGMFGNVELIVGLTCYAVGAIAYILLLTRVNLSVAAPAISMSYVFSVLIGHFWFRESIPVGQIIGLGAISIGVILVVSQK